MRSLASLLLLASAVSAQMPDPPLGDFHFVQFHLRGSRKPLARNLGGAITFDSGGRYRLRASMGSGADAAQPLTSEGIFQISAGGTLTMTNPARADARLRVRSGDGGRLLLGSSVDSGEEDYDLFVAFRAGSGLSAASVQGQYGGAYLTLARGDSAGLTTGYVELESDGAGAFTRSVISAHLASVDDAMRREQVTGSTYSLRADGTGTALFAEGSEVLAGSREILVSPGGEVILAYSAGAAQRDILIAVRKNRDVAPFFFRGPYWISELLAENDFVFNPEGARFGAAAGTVFSNGEGSVTVAQRVQMNGRRTNLSTINRYFLGSDGSSMFGPALRVGLANFALGDSRGLFVGAQVGEPGELVLQHGVFVGVRQTAAAGTGVFLDPLGISSPAAPGVPGSSISPGALVALAGSRLAAAPLRASGTPPLELGGVRVTFNGEAAPIVSVSPDRIEALAPQNLAPGLVRIQAAVNGTLSNSVEADVASTSPAVFSSPGGSGWAMAFHPDYSPVTPEKPAVPGQVVIVSVAGLGTDLNEVGALFAGRPGEIEFAGAMPGFVGVYQVNVKLPDELPPDGVAALALRTADSFTDLTEIPVRTARQ